ncbi:MAG: transcriptional regulator, MerR family [Caulobacter sp.]|nr:transcriptional regulator, MerR family [Caulobacter sp.]
MAKGPNAFRTISEAAEELGVPQHVLRFWETKFSFIRPMKRAGGRRFYRPQDIAMLGGVRALLHGDGYTIKGVQKLHKEMGLARVIAAGLGEAAPDEQLDAADVAESLAEAAAGLELAERSRDGLRAARDRLTFTLHELETVKAHLDGLLRGD